MHAGQTCKGAIERRQAVELGIRHIDCAHLYGNEDIVGEGLKPFIAAGRRKELFLVSKVWNDHHRPELVRQSAEETLANLLPEAKPEDRHLDVLLMHWPDAMLPGTKDAVENRDSSVTILQTWRAMEQLAKEGLTKYLGVSNFDLATLTELCKVAEIKPVCNQIELHPQLAQRKLVGGSLRQGVHSVAYAPLGILKGSPSLEEPIIQEIVKETGRPAAQIILKWNTQRGVVVIPKAQNVRHIKEILDGFFSWTLSNEQKARLDLLDAGTRRVNTSWHVWDKQLPLE